MSIVINPGSGPVTEAIEDWSLANMHVFAQDLRDAGHAVTFDDSAVSTDRDGRWTWVVNVDGADHEIDMPGIPVDRVRFLGLPGQDIWDFPRLYVDGSSWVWQYALGACRPDEDDEEDA